MRNIRIFQLFKKKKSAFETDVCLKGGRKVRQQIIKFQIWTTCFHNF